MWFKTKKIQTKEDAIKAIMDLPVFTINREGKIETILDNLIENELERQKKHHIKLIEKADD
jgi:hypothetical protein